MPCCPECFAHPRLKELVRERSKRVGKCNYCSSEQVPLIGVGELAGEFHNMISMYVEADSFERGEPLIDLIQWHWQVFDDDNLDRDTQIKLLEKICNSDWDDDSGEPMVCGKDLYAPLGDQFHTTHRERWEEFCYEVRENPEMGVPFDEYLVEEFGQFDVTLPSGTLVYRARRGFRSGEYGERLPYRGEEIGAPPPEKVSEGRANTKDQRVLYCADQEKTAIAEVRPALGFCVSIATFRLKGETRILDLTKDVEDLNPFETESLRWHVEIRGLLGALAEEMSRPLERNDDKTHYLPCQKLVAFIRRERYDGIRYPSALSPDGTNVVFFDPDIADFGDSKIAQISKLNLEYEIEVVKVLDPSAGAIAPSGSGPG